MMNFRRKAALMVALLLSLLLALTPAFAAGTDIVTLGEDLREAQAACDAADAAYEALCLRIEELQDMWNWWMGWDLSEDDPTPEDDR